MADVVKNLLLRITADSKQAEGAVGSFSASLGKIAIGAGAAVGAVALINKSFDALSGAISRGQGVNELSGAFKRLQEQAGRTADEGIARLRNATQGLLTDVELMGRSNLANQLGVTPALFEELAAGADTLADAVGVELPEALDALTEGFGRGNDRALKRLGIDVDLAAAQKAFAAEIGVTTDKLTEEEKKFASRRVAIEGFRKAVAAVSNDQNSAGEAVTRLSNVYENWIDRLSSAIEKNESLSGGIDSLASALSNIDPQPLISAIEAVVGALGTAIKLTGDFARGLDIIFNLSDGEKLKSLREDRLSVVKDLGNVQRDFPGLGGGISVPGQARVKEYISELEKINSQIAELEGKAKQTETTLATVNVTGAAIGDKPAAAAGRLTIAMEEAAKKAEEANQALKDLTSANNTDEIARGLEAAIDSLDSQKFAELKEKFRVNVREGLAEGLDLNNPAAKAELERSVDLATGELEKKWADASTKNAQDLQKKQEEAFQNSVNFFADILTPMFEDAAFNFEDIFMDAAKRVAVGFGSQMLAQLSSSVLGLDVSKIGNAQGLGQSLAQSIFGGTGGLGSLFGGATKGIGPIADGGQYALNIGQGSFSAMASSFGMSAGIAAGAYLAQRGIVDAIQGAKTRTPADAAARGQAAISSFGFSEVYRLFGFGPSQNPDRLARRAVRDQLQETGLGDELTFRTTRGFGDIKSANYNTDPNNKIVQGLIPFANPLAQIVTGGDDKLSKDFAGIFANAAGDADTLNEALINMKSLMDSLGFSAEEAKDQMKELFLDGKVELDEFKNGVAELNVIASENLIGTGSVADGLAIVGSEATSNRAKLTALGLTFKEFGEIGINSTQGIAQYLMDRFGPDAAEVFNRLAAIGIDSFEDVKNSSVDQVAAIFEILQSLPEAFAEASEQAKNKIKQDNEEIGKSYNKLKQDATFTPPPGTAPNTGTDGNSKRLQLAQFNNQRRA